MNDLYTLKQLGGGKPGRGAGRSQGANRGLQQALYAGKQIKSIGQHNLDKADFIRQRIYANGMPKLNNDGAGLSMQHVLPAMYDQVPNNNELSGQHGDDKRKRHRRTATEI